MQTRITATTTAPSPTLDPDLSGLPQVPIRVSSSGNCTPLQESSRESLNEQTEWRSELDTNPWSR